jgi:hypothetical protein
MPSQKLPQPNVPGQSTNQADSNDTKVTSTQAGQAAQDISNTKATYVFPKTTPGVSSRENPAGRPPEKPTLVPDKSLTEPNPLDQLAQTTGSVSAGGINPNLIGQKVALPKDLANSAEKKVQLPNLLCQMK